MRNHKTRSWQDRIFSEKLIVEIVKMFALASDLFTRRRSWATIDDARNLTILGKLELRYELLVQEFVSDKVIELPVIC